MQRAFFFVLLSFHPWIFFIPVYSKVNHKEYIYIYIYVYIDIINSVMHAF